MATKTVEIEEYRYAVQRSAVPVMRPGGQWPTSWHELWDICWRSKRGLVCMAGGFALQLVMAFLLYLAG